MNRFVRYLFFLLCAVQTFFAVAYVFQFPFAVELWPLPNTGPFAFIFIGSIFFAAAASTFWCTAARVYGALAGVALDYIVIFVPMAIFAFQAGSELEASALTVFGAVCVVGALFGVGLFLWSRRIPITDPRPQPPLVRWSFVGFVVALIIVGVLLVLKVPNILPWPTTPQSSVVYGWMFLGAAAYFAYGVLRPSWHNSAGQLAGFLAYDVVLIIPFLMRLPTVSDALRPSLIIYTLVVTYSGLLAIYYLFINPATRILGARLSRSPA